MARLSVNDLNNLSGINDESIDYLLKSFNEAYKLLFSAANRWLTVYNNKLRGVFSIGTKYEKYKEAKSLYYAGSNLCIDLDLFFEYTNEYISLMHSLRIDSSKITKYKAALLRLYGSIKDKMQGCFLIYDTAYKDINDEEENYG